MINNAKIVKLRCFEKKNNNLYLIVRLLKMKLTKMKKINQEKKVKEN
jgi:hypothetical protein